MKEKMKNWYWIQGGWFLIWGIPAGVLLALGMAMGQ